jgi:ATP-dependent exoDNAse (exonuclease V) beta subunit
MAGRVDCIGIFEDALSIIDFKTSSSFKEDYMAKPWFLQMTAYAIMVEELTGTPIEEITAIVSLENGNFQLFSADPCEYVDELYKLREQYSNLHGV